jgi:anhydro-N-acetylmuramic acid kinase
VSEIYGGLMSGTSMDAVDAGLFVFEDGQLRTLATMNVPWPPALQRALRAVSAETPIKTLGELDLAVAETFAHAVQLLLRQNNLAPTQVRAIGSHGQTILHLPHHTPPMTWQIGDPNRIAELTGITVVADFRRRDMAAGGQGAPLVPAFHQAMFGGSGHARAIVNVGGIANVTLLPIDAQQPVLGFDTGPGNGLMDAWIRQHRGMAYDAQGAWAAQGNVDKGLLERCLADLFFVQAAPKSTGPEYFNLAWLAHYLGECPAISPQDVQATLCALTACSIVTACTRYLPDCQELVVCGGGAHNVVLMETLQNYFGGKRVVTTHSYGFDPDFIEAAAFAWFAHRTVNGLPSNLPSATGARQAVVLGGIYQA